MDSKQNNQPRALADSEDLVVPERCPKCRQNKGFIGIHYRSKPCVPSPDDKLLTMQIDGIWIRCLSCGYEEPARVEPDRLG
jgi:hypothetical protein